MITQRRRKCPECAKKFIIHCSPEEYAYKSTEFGKTKYFCSWSCFRNAEKKHEHERMRRHKRNQELRREIWLKRHESA